MGNKISKQHIDNYPKLTEITNKFPVGCFSYCQPEQFPLTKFLNSELINKANSTLICATQSSSGNQTLIVNFINRPDKNSTVMDQDIHLTLFNSHSQEALSSILIHHPEIQSNHIELSQEQQEMLKNLGRTVSVIYENITMGQTGSLSSLPAYSNSSLEETIKIFNRKLGNLEW